MFANTVQPSVVSLFSSTGSKPLQLFEVHTDPDPEMRADSVVCFVRDDVPVDASGSAVRRAESLARNSVSTSAGEDEGEGGEDVLKLIEPARLYDVEGSDSDSENEGSGEDADEGEDRRRTVVGSGSETRRTRRREKRMGRELGQTVLHLQSPTIRSTYIRCPPASSSSSELGLGLRLGWMHVQVRPLGGSGVGVGSGRDAWALDVGVADRAGKRGVVRLSTFQVRSGIFLLPGCVNVDVDV